MNVGIAIRSLVMMSALATCAALGCSKKRPDPEATSEIARREAYARALLVDGGAVAYRIGSNADVQFADGFSIVQFDPADDWRSHAFRWMGPKGHVRLRTQGNEPMRLKLGGWVNEKVIDTKPEIRLYIDGQPLSPQAPSLVDQNQFFVFEVDVDPTLFHGQEWVNLDIVASAVAWHWSDAPELKVIVVFELGWERLNAPH
ncbi:MAG: hypothetical protein BGO98_36640 [Myxococcales bacterium 68-20]|nr:hypothetical protein [Myxococcales bacterium]OJY26104.1 MAG: hypothetical protein BGO98_36640 [Myxococcales bacterium 68-20]